jgi:predicted ATPase/class 3 adenylate cyclase/DNA-binding CsgD family transcriptional regulator
LWKEPALTARVAGDAAVVLPVGTVTLLLSDTEGSARLWEADREAMTSAVDRLDALITDAVGRHAGVRPVEQGEGDSFVAAFSRASDALACALALQLAIADEAWPGGMELRLRMALHTGEVQLRDEGNYIGAAINRCGRLRAIGHGGQTLLSRATHDLVVDRLPEEVSLLALGTCRLRDLARPEDVYQLGHPSLPAEFPPLRSLDALPNNLPVRLTSFIGREAEIAGLKELLAENRLVTLTGAGGVGKTRLALQAAADLLDGHPDGVWWVDLARITDAGLVPNAVAAALAVKEVPRQPLVETLKNDLRAKRTLILLDNCEHVVAACAELTDALLHACPSLSILATSREPLGVEGEAPWRVPSLTLPDEKAPSSLESLSQYEAVRLFIERAIAVRPNFQVTNENAPAVAQICHRLDGIPLAMELAAARTRMMTPEQIVEGLMDRFHLLTGGVRTVLPRQQTLRASVDWSYNLLGEDERGLLRRLSVFVGSFTLDAAEEVGSADGSERQEVLELLSRLVDRSLVQVEEAADAEARYRLLETIRQYGRDRLAESGPDGVAEEAAVRTRHLDFYVALAERAEPEMEGAGLMTWLERLDLELGNLRAALDWSAHAGEADKGLRLASAVRLFWVTHGDISEGRGRLAVALSPSDGDPLLRANALCAASFVQLNYGDVAAIRAFGGEALRIARGLSDKRTSGRALNMLGWASMLLDPASAPALYEEAIELCRETDDAWWLADALIGFGFLQWQAGDLALARPRFEEALSIARPAGNRRGVETSLGLSGFVLVLLGELSEAEAAFQESLVIARELRDRFIMAIDLYGLGNVATYRGEYESAAELFEESLSQARESSPLLVPFVLMFRGVLDYARGDFETATGHLEEAVILARAMRILWGVTWDLRTLGDVARARGDLEAAGARLEEAVDVGRQAGGWVLGLALQGAGRLARSQGDRERAESLHHEALELFQEARNKLDAVEALESLAGLAALAEGLAEAARLFGAAEALRESIGYVRFLVEREAYEADVAIVREGLTEEEFRRAWEEGRAMSLDEAVAYASRGRGERKRPSTGWASLTPSELQVVRLVAEGLSNPKIGERLFISRRTVQTHLKHVFAKLGVTSRAELASEATRRQGS